MSRLNALKGFMAAEENIPFTPTDDAEVNEKAMMNALEQLDVSLSGQDYLGAAHFLLEHADDMEELHRRIMSGP